MLASCGAYAQTTTLSTVEVADRAETGLTSGISPEVSMSLPASFSNSVQVFDRDKIEKMPVSDVFQVLDMAAGMSVAYHGRKAHNLVGMRAGSNLGIVLDGALIPTPAAAKMLAALPLNAIEKIEVVRDSSALNLGPLSAPIGAMTDNRTEGFVLITTRSALSANNSLTAGIDNAGLRQIGVSHGQKLGSATGIRATLNHAERDEVDSNNKGYERNAGYFKVSHVTDSFWVDLSLFRSSGRTDLQRAKEGPGIQPGLRNAKWSYDPTEMTMASLQATKSWTDTQATTLRAAYTNSDASLYQKKYNPAGPGMAGVEKTEEKFFSVDLSHAMQLGSHHLRIWASLFEWDNPTGMLNYPGIEIKERTHSLYLQDEFKVGKWSFDAGIRSDKRYLDKGFDEAGTQKNAFKNRELDPLFAISAGALYQFSDDFNTTFRILYTQQDPTSLATVGTGSLPKEERMRYELGLNKYWSPYLTTKATVFLDKLSNAAYVASYYSDSDGVMHNLYDSNNRDNTGIELMLNGNISGFSYDLSYSRVNPGKTPSPIVNTPENMLKAHLGWQGQYWSADLTSKYVDRYLSSSHAATDYAGDFVTTDIQVSRTFHQSSQLKHKVSLYVKNLEDKNYETMYGFPDEGRSFGLAYQLNY